MTTADDTRSASVIPLEDEESENAFDAGEAGDFSGPWCRCCPSFVSMGSMTAFLAISGFGFGAALYESKAHENWLDCYSDPGNPAPYSCWLDLVGWPGILWIKALKMLVLPLMCTMMLTLPAKIYDELGAVGIRLVALLTLTSFFAAMEGLFWAAVIKPGQGVDPPGDGSALANDYVSELEAFLNIISNFVPDNIIAAMADIEILGVISVFLAFGIQIYLGPKQWSKPIFDVANGILRASLRLVVKLMWFTPIAMFSMVSYNLAKTEDLWMVFKQLGKYVGAQLLGQFLHLTIFYFLMYFLATGKNPLVYFWRIKDAPVTAFITSSSLATLPVTMRVNLEAGNDSRLVGATIPIGSGMNMDGTSLGFPIMVLFTAQLAGLEMAFASQLTIALLAMVCSLGTAPVPNAGLVFLTMLFAATDLTITQQSYGYGLISTVDWLVDRVETAQNVTSDSFICGILHHYFTGGTGCLTCCMRGMMPSEEELQKLANSQVAMDTGRDVTGSTDPYPQDTKIDG